MCLEENHGLATVQETHLLPVKEVRGTPCRLFSRRNSSANGCLDRRQWCQTAFHGLSGILHVDGILKAQSLTLSIRTALRRQRHFDAKRIYKHTDR